MLALSNSAAVSAMPFYLFFFFCRKFRSYSNALNLVAVSKWDFLLGPQSVEIISDIAPHIPEFTQPAGQI